MRAVCLSMQDGQFLKSVGCACSTFVCGYDPGRTRTCNPRLCGPMPYPFGLGAVAFCGAAGCVLFVQLYSLQFGVLVYALGAAQLAA